MVLPLGPAPSERVIIVGAGIGGLSAAVALAQQGLQVEVLEARPLVGGKLRCQEVAGRTIDAGPTVLTMRWVFDELCATAGATLDELLPLTRAERLARHFWDDGAQLDLYCDRERSAAAIAAFAGEREAAGFRRFCDYAARIYAEVEQPFLRDQRPTVGTLVRRTGLRGLAGLWRIDSQRTMWQALSTFFADPRLRQLFGRYATYCGSSPFAAPATLNLVAHVEQQGIWLIGGGMHRLAEALAALARAAGATIRCGTPVERLWLEGGRLRGVRLGDGELLPARAVIVNADLSTLATRLLDAPTARQLGLAATPRAERSLSALTWATLGPTSARADATLVRHNVFFHATDYADEFDAVLRRGELPTHPTVYVCAQDRDDDGRIVPSVCPPDARPAATTSADGASGARERLLLLVNAPPRAGERPLAAQEIAACRERVERLLGAHGLPLGLADAPTALQTPDDFETLAPGTGGAIYGPLAHSWRSSFARAGSRTALPGLYLAGGSVHPGPGLPMVALSGRLAAQSVAEDLGARPHPRPAG